MMLKSKGRAALLTCALLATGLGLSSCGTSTLGYLYVTSVQFGQVLSFRLNINNGKIGGTNCSVSNSGQQSCNNSTGGANPTKLVSAAGGDLVYVLNTGSTSPASAGNIALFTLGGSGTVYSTGQTFSSSGQNPIDMFLSPSGGYLFVLDQYQPASVAGCATPTPSTCAGDITVFQIGSNGNLVVVINQTGPNNTTPPYFPVGFVPDAPTNNYGGNHFYAVNGFLYVLDNSLGTNKPQVDTLAINPTNSQLTSNNTAPTLNGSFSQPFAITGSGGDVFIADYGNGAIWTYTAPASGNGSLSGAGNGYFCPANPAYVYTQGGSPNQPSTGGSCNTATVGGAPAQFDALLLVTSGTNPYLYAADFNSANTANLYSMTVGSTTGGILSLSTHGVNPIPLGNSPTCITVSSGTPYLYVSGNGSLAGEQIDTATGVLTTQNNPATSVPVQGYNPCLYFSGRT